MPPRTRPRVPSVPKRSPHRPRVVVKLVDDAPLPVDDRQLDVTIDRLTGGRWRRMKEQSRGASIQRLFTAVTPARLEELVAEARRRDRTYRPPNFRAFLMIEGADDARAVVDNVRGWPDVERVYVEPRAGDPMVAPQNDPRQPNQGYLDPAPVGIDAEFAWTQAGGDGKGQDFIDLELGWTFNHEDLKARKPALVHGVLVDESRPHGTAVLGEVCAVDNTVGCVGIAPKVGSVKVVSYEGSSIANAIVAARSDLPFGGVLLLEAQLLDVEIGDALMPPLPVETDYAVFQIILLATTGGVTVVEAAGNGSKDLDTYKDELGQFVLKRGVRDSGAIVVGAGKAAHPHARKGLSNFGSRVDCYAWGEKVDTTSSTPIAPFTTDDYTTSFDGTSSASAIIAGAALVLQGVAEATSTPHERLSPAQVRALLSDPTLGTPSKDPLADRIGVMPDLRKILLSNAFVTRRSP